MVSKEEHQLTEWKNSPNGDESNLAIALNQNSINKSTIEELKQVLRLVMVKVGLRANNLPNDHEKQVLIDHIITHYGNHTPNEVRLAFEMALTFKLDLPEKDIPCYENFTCAYVSKIMNAYRKWAIEAYPQIKKEPPMTELEPIEMIDWIEEWRNKPIVHLDLIPLCFYDFLVTTDMIQVSKEMKWDYVGKAATAIKTQLLAALPECKTTDARIEYSEFERMEKEGFTGKFKERINNKAKRLIVFDYLKK